MTKLLDTVNQILMILAALALVSTATVAPAHADGWCKRNSHGTC